MSLMSPTKFFSLLFSCALSTTLFSAVSFTRTDVSYDLTAVGSAGELFVASSIAPGVGDESYAISRGVLEVDEASGAQKVTEKGLLPLRTQLNGATSLDPVTKKLADSLVDNPIRGQVIPWLSVYGNQPVVVFGSSVDQAHSVAVISDNLEGRKVLTNISAVRDAVGATTRTIKAAVGAVHNKHGFVFAAATPNDSPLFEGQDEAGIAVLHVTPKGLVPVDASGARGGARAARLSSDVIQIGGTGSIDGVTAMYWDHHLNRLFVGLNLDSGGVAVVVGELRASRVTTAQGGPSVYDVSLSLRPIISGANGINEDDDWDGNDYVVADENDGRTIKHLSVMHASTGTSYVVASRDDGLIDGDKVYALPITNTVSDTCGEDTLAHLATITDFAVPATQGSDVQLHTSSSTAAQVGGGTVPADITSMHVVGDSVFISCAGDDEAEQGVFVSTALFDTAGNVIDWSVWQRVSGAARPTYGFGVDAAARTWYLTGADGDTRDTMHVATWGAGVKNTLWGGSATDASVGLVSKINTVFPPMSGGVQTVRMFKTDSLAPSWYDAVPQINDSVVMAAVGRNKCALALTMKDDVRTTGTNFDTAERFISFDLADDDLTLGMLSCVAMTRDGGLGAKSTRVLVGGPNGLAVLSQTDGDGVSDLNDLSDLSDYRFKELKKADGTSFANVRQIQSDADAVYVLTDTALYKFLYSSDKFKDTEPDALDASIIASAATVLGSTNHSFLSFILLESHAVLGTTSGLWTMKDGTLTDVANQLGTGGWQQIMVTPGGTDPFGVCSQLTFEPSQSAATGGMLSVLTADMALNVAIVYRVAMPTSDLPTAIDAGTVGAVAHTIDSTTRTYATLLGQLREYFYTNGAFAIDASSSHHAFSTLGNGMLRVLPITRSVGNIDQWVYSSVPSLEVSSPMHTVGRVVQDPATGTLIVPGIWGVRVLQ